ncbi:MAG: hypothetical protein B6I35_13670 [Anaerolineaceae bacterium 4572_32.2]|nr:MAG: hypothetical protein B6I35_13670 [Anaerolineaceae bacterium 4572_32.2]HEY71782.1 DUF1624 domain-containing protein [Thermoflexia bacterium]
MSENSQTVESEGSDRQAPRLVPLDALRGLIIILMALDHANHFVAQQHSAGEYWGGPFPRYGDVLAFLTRLVTHLSAPGFFFLMGVGMLLFANSRRKRGWSRWAIVGHFLARGGLLIALQLLVVNRAWELSAGGWGLEVYIGVLFALGGTMILGSLFLWFKPNILLPLTIVLVLGVELLTPDPGQWNQAFSLPARLLLVPGGNLALWVNYPVLPWLELVAFGILFGHWLVDDPRKAFGRALKLGAVFLLAFVALRTLDGFGNIRPRAGDAWIDFLNVVKYPPSITFNLLTMGVGLIALGLFAQAREELLRCLRPLIVFGQAPLFFYLTHLFLYAGLGLWLTPDGTTIPAMYPYWLLGLLILYPLCLWYGRFKHRQLANSILRFL